ncbi:MAG: hypothetical protein ACK5LC_00285, partial [Coprobacillaceae bacterium]
MRYYNSEKKYYMPVVGDEPNIIDDNSTPDREIKIECVRFFVNSEIVKNVGDSFIIRHKSSGDGDDDKAEDWFTAVSDRTIRGFTTFKTIVPSRSSPIS